MLQRLGAFVGGFLLAPEHHDDLAFGVELDDHVGAFVGGPDVVILVDAHGVRERPGIEIVADFANVLAVLIEFQKLRGGGGIGRTVGVPARKNEDMSLGIYGDAGYLAEIQIGRKFEHVGHGIKRNFRRTLAKHCQWRTNRKCQNQRKLFHRNLPEK